MPTVNRAFLLGLVGLQAACSSPWGSQQSSTGGNSGGATGSGGAVGGGGAAGLGGASAVPVDARGSGGAGGTATSFTPTRDPTFDPSVLVIDAGSAIDTGSAIDADLVHSAGIVIFDRSGSMSNGWTTATTDNPDSAVTVTKWVAASRALIGALTPVQERVTIGAVLFPSDDACGVAPFGDAVQFAFMPGPQFLQEYIARSPYDQPQGNTPLAVAFQVADQAIKTAQSQGLLQMPFYVMLLTDGEPNCDSDMSVVLDLAASWLAQGIQTHVFGLPGSESARAVLDSVAQAGGTQTLVVPGSSEGLQGLQTGIAAVVP